MSMYLKDIVFNSVLILGIFLVVGVLVALIQYYEGCVPGDVQVCTWHSPYTDQQEVGKQICSSDGWWMGCHPLCESNESEE